MALEQKMTQAFPKEYSEAQLHKKDYRYLYNMLKERKNFKEVIQAFKPSFKVAGEATMKEKEDQLFEMEKRLSSAYEAVSRQYILDSN